MSDSYSGEATQPRQPRTLRDALDKYLSEPGVTLNEYTSLEELDNSIACTPQLKPLRELHAIVPRLLAKPRDDELNDPFLALHELAGCLVTRVRQEIWANPIERDHLRTQAEVEIRKMHPNANLPTDPWPPWDPRPIFTRHRVSCCQVLHPHVQKIGLEAKRLAARNGRASEGQKVVNDVLHCIRTLGSWRTSELSTEKVRPFDAELDLQAFCSNVCEPAIELLTLFTHQLPSSDEDIYDPCKREPTTFGELLSFADRWAALPFMPGTGPLVHAKSPAYQYLVNYCTNEFGTMGRDSLNRLKAKYALATGKTDDQIDVTTLKEMADFFRPPAAQANEVNTGKAKSKKRRRAPSPRPLTPKEAEAVHLVGEHKGNVTAAALAAGKSRQVMQRQYDKAMKKLGKKAMPTAKTVPLPTDRRGQPNLSEDRE